MQKELIDKANKIISLIEENERAVAELGRYAQSGKVLYTETDRMYTYNADFPVALSFEDWEIRLMIH